MTEADPKGPCRLIDLINDIDNLPYYEADPERFSKLMQSTYSFCILDNTGNKHVVGYMLEPIVKGLAKIVDEQGWKDKFQIENSGRTVCVQKTNTHSETAILKEFLDLAREQGTFEILKGWRNENYRIFNSIGADIELERSGAALFGVLMKGVHCTAYVQSSTDSPAEIKIWVPKRSKTVKTYAGFLDNSFAGGISAKEHSPFEALVREAHEEASLAPDLVRSNARAVGTVSYWHQRDSKAGGEQGLLQPECQYVYDMLVPEDIILKQNDTEVDGFGLMTVPEVIDALKQRRFKPNCAGIIIDFLVRHGYITAESDPQEYDEIASRLHRHLKFQQLGPGN